MSDDFDRINQIRLGQIEALRAELAAANARNAELEKKVTKAYKMRHNHITRDIKPDGECAGCDAYHLIERNRENAALQARLDRVTALLPDWQMSVDSDDTAFEILVDLRDALEIEGDTP